MFRCEECTQTFYSKVDCDQHVERDHPDSADVACIRLEYRCTFCGMTFQHESDVTNHALRDHGIQRVEVEVRAAALV